MGMDVYGRNPTSKRGEYFRNNVWWWRPLAMFVEDAAPDICSPCKHWHSNDGDGLDADGAKALADKLTALLDSGEVKKYEEEYNKEIEALPDEPCDLCEGTGKRPASENWDPEASWARECNGCNKCNGTGSVKPWESNYPFSEENVKEFRDFLKDSGGFNIW